MIDNLIRATTVFPPTLAASPFQEQDASLPCFAFDERVQQNMHRDESIRLFTALDKPDCDFIPTLLLSMFRDAPSTSQSREQSGKLPPALDKKALSEKDVRGVGDVCWVSDPSVGPLMSVLCQAPETL